MKIVFFGYDYSIPTLRRLLDDGHEIIAIVSFNSAQGETYPIIVDAAKQLGVSLHVGRVTSEQMEDYVNQGAELFLSTGYRYKIPVVDESKAYAINLHPTLLPHGRGLMPMPKLFLEYPEYSGVTAHKISEGFDEGDIILQQPLPIADTDDIAVLSARFSLKSADIVSEILSDIENYWGNAKPQAAGEGGWWDPPVNEDRFFDWSKDAAATSRMIQAFGRFGMIADFDGQRWVVVEAKAWSDEHNYAAGTVVLRLDKECVIALSDGYVMLKEFYLLQQ